MAKKALCVGINDYPYDGNDLNGCVNDAEAWASLLVDHYDFPRPDVTLLTDGEATKAGILQGLQDLLAGARARDVLVFTNSSHGSYIADEDGDEELYDEVLCPYDADANLLRDDELRALFADLPARVRLTVIADACFSGTVTRAAVGEILPGLRTPDDRHVRFLSPALRGEKILANPWRARARSRLKHPQARMNEVLVAGCSDREYSYDAYIDGVYHGAMTYHAIKAIREARYRITYAQLGKRTTFLLDDAGYPQHPQVEGKSSNKRRPIFT